MMRVATKTMKITRMATTAPNTRGNVGDYACLSCIKYDTHCGWWNLHYETWPRFHVCESSNDWQRRQFATYSQSCQGLRSVAQIACPPCDARAVSWTPR